MNPRKSLHSICLPILLILVASCSRADPPGANPPQSTRVQAKGADSNSPFAYEPPSASAPSTAAPAPSAKIAAPPADPQNKAKPPLASEDLDVSAKALFDAVVKDDPDLAKAFFFPREPFTPLKDAADPDRYWRQLFATYQHDIHKLHQKQRDWSKASFESFELGSPPTWVKPGDEANKIGYFRTFRGRLNYRHDGKKYHLETHTIISWDGHWYITHLLPFKH